MTIPMIIKTQAVRERLRALAEFLFTGLPSGFNRVASKRKKSDGVFASNCRGSSGNLSVECLD